MVAQDAPSPRAVIIEAALNGGTPQSRNPHVPRSVDEIVEDALACIEAGAAIVHNHNDEPVIGQPIHSAEPYLAAYTRIRQAVPDAILYPTMGGGALGVTMAARYAHVEKLTLAGHLRMGLVDPGSVNFGGLDSDGRPMASETIYLNTYGDTRYMIDWCAAHQLGPSLSIFEPGFLRLALAYHAAGALPRGALVKLYFSGGGPYRAARLQAGDDSRSRRTPGTASLEPARPCTQQCIVEAAVPYSKMPGQKGFSVPVPGSGIGMTPST